MSSKAETIALGRAVDVESSSLEALFEQQCARTPDALAVEYEEKTLTYAQLDARAERTAADLRRLGVGPDVVVGVLMERSIELMVALLAILKAGGAYLPLDPENPAARLAFVLGDAGAPVVLTQPRFVELLSGVFQGAIKTVSEAEPGKTSGTHLRRRRAGPDDLAYVIYTSGSTGQPKGCMISHRAICNRLLWMQDTYRLSGQDRVLQKTPYTFDVSVWELFWPLISGACVVFAAPGGHRDTPYLVGLIQRRRITICHFVPSMLRFFLADRDVQDCSSLRDVFVSGEALPYPLMARFLNLLSARLHNLYGPTEAAVDVTFWPCALRDDGKAPIGRAISGVELHILDEALLPVSSGEEGELCISGVALARGYLNRPDLTQERFTLTPSTPPVRIYRTGDRARMLSDGNIEFLGRHDFQVKLRGLRIELGEIETALRDHPEVREAAVMVRGDDDDPRLVAYLETSNPQLDARQIRSFLAERLPDYMVPNVVAAMAQLPVTRHGKLDRDQLPWPLANSPVGRPRPRTDTEGPGGFRIDALLHRVLVLCEEVMDQHGVQPDDDLFERGATSLTLARLAEKVREALGAVISVDIFLDRPTARNVAEYILNERAGLLPGALNQVDEAGPGRDRRDDQTKLNDGPTSSLFGRREPLIDAITMIASEVMARDLGPDDDLFGLGATSLTMVRLAERVRAEWEVIVPTDVFLDDPTVRSIAAFVAAQRPGGDRPGDLADSVVQDPPGRFDELRVVLPPVRPLRPSPPISDITGLAAGQIPFEQFARLVGQLRVEIGTARRCLHASAGGLGAVRAYFLIRSSGVVGLAGGAYYYDPEANQLVKVGNAETLAPESFRHEAAGSAQFAIVLVAAFQAIAPLYADASAQLVTVEAGYIAQTLWAAAPDAGLALLSASRPDAAAVARALDLSGSEQVVHVLLGGYENTSATNALNAYSNESDQYPTPGRALTQATTSLAEPPPLTQDLIDDLHARRLHIRPDLDGRASIPLGGSFPQQAYERRASHRAYADQPIPLSAIGDLLGLRRPSPTPGRPTYQFTAGAPERRVELFVYAREGRVDGLEGGVYAYDEVAHALVRTGSLSDDEVIAAFTPFNRRHAREAGFLIFLAAAPWPGVGEFDAAHLLLLEAGSLGQLFLTRQCELGLGLCPIGGLRFEKLRHAFGPRRVELLHSFTGGRVDRAGSVQIVKPSSGPPASRTAELAIVGMSLRVPGAESLDAYWENLTHGVVSIGRPPPGRETLLGMRPDAPPVPGGYLHGIDCFDSLLFGISPAEARSLDPQERLLLESAWACLEDAGYTATTLSAKARAGVFVGAMWNDYQNHGVEFWRRHGVVKEFSTPASLANRLSHVFGCDGPSVAFNTSCSSGMTALHFACQSLLQGECEAALVGGVNLVTHAYHLDLLDQLDFMSSDGRCRPFSALADGWVIGEGVGVLLVKPMEAAKRDGDHVHATIRATSIAHTGKTSRFGVPNSMSQVRAIRTALEVGGLSARDIDYVEAAAPGSSLADAAEISALNEVFKDLDGEVRFVGSVKGNIGHLESASAFSQIAKVVAQLRHESVAPSMHGLPRNPLIVPRPGLEIADTLRPWPRVDGKPRRALINMVGATGSGGHLILEEACVSSPRPDPVGHFVVPLSAATDAQLTEVVRRLADFLGDRPQTRIDDLAFTLATGRTALRERLAVVAGSSEELSDKLHRYLAGQLDRTVHRGSPSVGAETAVVSHDPSDMARAWVVGAVELSQPLENRARRVSLPTYPFERVRHWLSGPIGPAAPMSDPPSPQGGAMNLESVPQHSAATDSTQVVERRVAEATAKVLEFPVNRLLPETAFADIGLTSALARALTLDLEADFGPLPPTLLFEHHTLGEVAAFLAGLVVVPASSGSGADGATLPVVVPRRPTAPYAEPRSAGPSGELSSSWSDIAIVGLSGRYPGSSTLAELWENLRSGRDCVEEIPRSRWAVESWHDPVKGTAGRSYCRWGGFLEEVDQFDPLFFGISPREAEVMDPQGRLLLEAVWTLFEGAGLTREKLKQRYDGQVGVFAGASGVDIATLANRVSHFFGLEGPSLAVDTMCSSSAMAIHLACRALQQGECALAVAGGVNLSIHPGKYVGLSQLQMLGSHAGSRSFSDGDGFLPAEGVGAVLLKPLAQAQADGDDVLAVIRGTASRHGGRGGGYSVPNPGLQAKAAQESLSRSGISASSVSYVEAAANGSALGDAIEVAALGRVFAQTGPAVALGSVKSNLGHPEAVSGLAQLSKVVLQMRHGELAASILSEPLNPNLRLEETPFVVQRQTQAWRRPVVDGVEVPRRALINSYGAGGTYVSLVVEEAPEPAQASRAARTSGPQVLVFSARTPERLQAVAERMRDWVAEHPELDLEDVAWTLQTRREAMECRLALVAGDREGLLASLTGWLAGTPAAGTHAGDVDETSAALRQLLAGRSGEAFAASLIAEHDLDRLALYWTQGGRVRWEDLHASHDLRPVPLPTYPFARTRCWAAASQWVLTPEASEAPAAIAAIAAATPAAGLDVRGFLAAALCAELKLEAEALRPGRALTEYGLDSVMGMRLRRQVEARFQVELTAREMVEHPSLDALVALIQPRLPANAGQALEIIQAEPSSGAHLSQGQLGLWWLQKTSPSLSGYHIPLCLRFKPGLDAASLEASLAWTLDRHPVLSRVIVETPQGPRQVRGGRAVAVTREALPGSADRLARLEALTRAPFDLSEGPLLRAHLLEGDGESLLLIVLHHLVIDGQSVGVFLETLLEAYGAYVSGVQPQAGAAAARYEDFVAWEQTLLSGPRGADHLAYWRGQLAGPLPVLELPTDHARHGTSRTQGRTLSLRLPQGLQERLRAFASQGGWTTASTLLATYQVLLHRYTGQEDLIVGTPTLGRPQARFEAVVGYFVNMIPLRSRVEGAMSFTELLSQAQLTLADGLDHAAYPFPALVRELKVARVAGQPPVFQVVFAYQATPEPSPLPSGIEVVEGLHQEGEYELVLEVFERADGHVLNFKYDPELFEASTVARMAEHYLRLLEAGLSAPDQALGGYTMLTAEERQTLLVDWNDTRLDHPDLELCVHQLFQRQAQQTPDALAVSYEGQSLSFDALNRAANRLAHHLIGLGVGPDQRVAICMERSLEMVVGLLAILKAGGAYVPLDPDLPPERLAALIADCAPVALLSQSALAERLPAKPTVLWLNTPTPIWGDQSDADPIVAGLEPSHLAYVIYTSGSTGTPKGVAVEHRSVVNFWRVMGQTTHSDLKPGARTALNAAYFFDMSIKGLAQLLSGHSLIVIPQSIRADGPAFLSFLDREKIDAFDSTPSQLNALVAAGLLEMRGYRPKRVLLGGEPIDPKTWSALRSASIEFFNMYGPTECTVDATIGRLRDLGETPSIGRPISNLQVYVLDARGEPTPIGVAGEIHIGGLGVARGYHDRPDLTAERFVPDPFADVQGGRLYKTGDVGRWRSDGTLEYLGRNDFQVKIRGYRIELGEIEARLKAHPLVADAVVIAREDQPGRRQLVAYHTPVSDQHAAPDALREELKSWLPTYMVPSHYVSLARLPLTPNGKLDRAALPEPASHSSAGRMAPQGLVEERLAAAWCEVLGIAAVGREDNFFELGGHSLLIVAMQDRLRQTGLDVAVSEVFNATSLADLAACIIGRMPELSAALTDRPVQGAVSSVETPVNPASIGHLVKGGAQNIQDVYPLTPLQEGVFFHHLLDRVSDVYVISVLCQAETRAQLDALLAAWQVMVDRHDILRTAIIWEGLPRPLQVVWRRAELPVEEIILDAGADPIEQLSARMTPTALRMNLDTAPMLRFVLARDPASHRWYALLKFHHLISDHVTLEVLQAEIAAVIDGRLEDLSSPIPFRRFAEHAQAVEASGVAERYFNMSLGGVTTPTAPFGLTDVRGDGGSVREARHRLDDDLAQAIRRAARRRGVSPATIFHAAWGIVIGAASGQDDVVFATVMSGRLQGLVGADRAVGMFTNPLPLRLRLSDLSPTELIAQTQAQLVELIALESSSLATAQRCSGMSQGAALVSAILNYRHSTPAPKDGGPGIRLAEGVHLLEFRERSNYPLAISVDDLGEAFELTAQVSRELEPARINRLLATALTALVQALETDAEKPVLALSVLPEEEVRQLMDFADGGPPAASDMLFPRLFESWAARTPDALALSAGDERITYADLNRRANQLAYVLRRRGIAPGKRVALCFERGSVAGIVALLAALKAGAAYVPLEPSHPLGRIEQILSDAAPALLLTTSKLAARLPQEGAAKVLLDKRMQEVAKSPDCDLEDVPLAPSSAAYVIYTSGSTGSPKGVLTEHAGLANLALAQAEAWAVRPGSRVLQFASLAFDASASEIAMTLASGATLVLAAEIELVPGGGFETTLRREAVTHVTIPPFVAALASPARLDALEVVILAGEAPQASAVRDWAQDGRRVVNAYGPTEATVCAAWHECVPGEAGPQPIGRPLRGARLYVLDEHDKLCPVGCEGQICIGGIGVARGYMNQPSLTDSAFSADPFVVGGRLYRTGDRGRWRLDGRLEFLGRADAQIKVRGARLEPREVETLLSNHPDVRQAVVFLTQESVEPRLVACVVANSESRASASVLRTHLSKSLPNYMVPQDFIFVDDLPQTPTGKLDRRSIQDLAPPRKPDRGYVPPRSPLEQKVAEVWSNVLAVPKVGRESDFFDLGGHSLAALRMIATLGPALGVELCLSTIFDHPTLAMFAAEVGDQVMSKILSREQDASAPPGNLL